ncbi:MAG: hypothetical protein M5T61_09925 [Acidimicrobiia bacterium]|nr:hypothetical protein [Acidimicrobiia bacterium]
MNLDEVPLVIGRALFVVHELGLVREQRRSRQQTVFEIVHRADQQCFGAGATAWNRARGADDEARGIDAASGIVQVKAEGDAQHRPLVELDLVIGDALRGG